MLGTAVFLSVVLIIEIGSLGIFSEKLGCFHRTSFFGQILYFQLGFFLCEVMQISVKALKKMSCLKIVASSSLMFCWCKNTEEQRNQELIHCIHVLFVCLVLNKASTLVGH